GPGLPEERDPHQGRVGRAPHDAVGHLFRMLVKRLGPCHGFPVSSRHCSALHRPALRLRVAPPPVPPVPVRGLAPPRTATRDRPGAVPQSSSGCQMPSTRSSTVLTATGRSVSLESTSTHTSRSF